MTFSLAAQSSSKQKTLKQEIERSGVGLFTGENVFLSLRPAPVDHGIIFKRADLPDSPVIHADLTSATFTHRCTRLMKDGVSVQTVEHLLSALHVYGISNLEIELHGPELPAGDGSSSLFVEMIESAGVSEQKADREIFYFDEPLSWSEGETHLIALPSPEFRISYTLHYPHSPYIRSQYYSYPITTSTYKTEIAPSRTFSLYEEIEPMLKKGLLGGAGLDNGVVIKGDRVMNVDGVRFDNEMVRHKILDLIGDLYLIGFPICAHIISIRSGHYSNIEFSKKIRRHILEKRAVHG